MINTSLLNILRSFCKNDLKKFESFVLSPYFNKQTGVTNLFRHILKYYPKFDNVALERKTAWKILYPGKDFNYGVMKNLLHNLTLLAERFLSEEMFSENEFWKNYFMLDKLSRNNLTKIFNSKFGKINEKFTGSVYDSDKFYQIAELKWLRYSNIDSLKKSDGENVYKISEFKIYDMLINLFKMYNNIVNEKIMLNYSVEYRLLQKFIDNLNLPDLIEYIRVHSPDNYIVINIYYHIYKAIEFNKTSENFYDFKKVLTENDGLFSKAEKNNLYSCLVTALTNNKSIINRTHEYLEIYKLLISKDLILDEEGYISLIDYSAPVRMAAMLKDEIFIESFLNNFTDKLLPQYKENMERYGRAYLLFTKKEFARAIELTNKIDFDILSFKYDLKNLQIMIKYELKDFYSITYTLDSYRHFASKNQFVSPSVNINILNFTEYVTALCRLNEKPDLGKLVLLKESIRKDRLNTKHWLLEKISEIEIENK